MRMSIKALSDPVASESIRESREQAITSWVWCREQARWQPATRECHTGRPLIVGLGCHPQRSHRWSHCPRTTPSVFSESVRVSWERHKQRRSVHEHAHASMHV